MRKHPRTPGIFCLEGPWTTKLTDRSSVEPMLDLLERSSAARFLYDRVHTRDELFHLVGKWTQKQYSAFSVGYLAFHGSPGAIHLAQESVTLDELASELAGGLSGKVVHFGSCEVLKAPARQLEAFRRATGAKAITGYRAGVDWMQSAAFDLLYLNSFAHYTQMDAVERAVRRQAAGLARELKFTVVRRKSPPSR